jgi:D-alanyl-D-alanine carboxypeptidase
LKDWLARMLLVSDADIAEGVSKLVTLKAGLPATWTNGKTVRDAVLKKYAVEAGAIDDFAVNP